MSYRCQRCNEQSKIPDSPLRIVTVIREKVYPKRYAKDGKTVIDNGGIGWEIAKEENLCATCASLRGVVEV